MSFGVMAHENDEVGLKTKTRIKSCPQPKKIIRDSNFLEI
jgi:hypothetical protein